MSESNVPIVFRGDVPGKVPGAETPPDGTSACAIEIAAMLGDSMVGVTHLTDPKRGAVTPRTWGTLVLGALFLLLAVVGFSAGLRNAAFNKHSGDEWTRSGRRAHEWRPRRISPAYDWMTVGGATGGLTLLTLGLARLRSERRSPCFRIGSDRSVEFATADAPSPAFPLVMPRDNGFVLTFTRDMDGEIHGQGWRASLNDLWARGPALMSEKVAGAFELAIPVRARITVCAGKTRFLISSVAAPRRQAPALFAAVERRMVVFGAGSAVVHLGLWALLNTIPPDPQPLAEDPYNLQTRMARILTKPNDAPVVRGEEARKTGSPPGCRIQGVRVVKGTPGNRNPDSCMALAVTGDFPWGMDDSDIYDLPLGDGVLAGHMMDWCGVGKRLDPMRNRETGVPAVRIGEATQSDGLDRSIIRRYVRRVLPRIRYCYEKQLAVHPGLAGTVMSQFLINPQGAVISSTASGVHEDVSSCVADVLKTIRFPKPNQNTRIEVNYPFIFRPTGG